MNYGSASRARLVASISNRKRTNGPVSWAVYRDGMYQVVLAVFPPNDIV